jgi:hypothetical protein
MDPIPFFSNFIIPSNTSNYAPIPLSKRGHCKFVITNYFIVKNKITSLVYGELGFG